MHVYGVPEKENVSAEYREAAKSASQAATSSLSNSRVPREMESRVKGYFDSVEQGVE